MHTPTSLEEYQSRFWSYVDKKGKDECWVWKNARFEFDYGAFSYKNKNILAHRFAYECIHGEGSAEGKVVRHTCDNPPCCNPNHLIIGTQGDNNRDKIERGRDRHLIGDECSWSILTEKDVIEIKKLFVEGKISHTEIAKQFGVSKVTICDINMGKTWKHIQPELIAKKRKDFRTYIKELLGRKTLDGIVIHYVDGNSENKDHSNVVVCPSHAYHCLLMQRKDAYEACGHADWIKCTYCKQYDKPENMYQKATKTNYRPDETFYRFHKKCQREHERKTRSQR